MRYEDCKNRIAAYNKAMKEREEKALNKDKLKKKAILIEELCNKLDIAAEQATDVIGRAYDYGDGLIEVVKSEIDKIGVLTNMLCDETAVLCEDVEGLL
jgi:hypothetical protein